MIYDQHMRRAESAQNVSYSVIARLAAILLFTACLRAILTIGSVATPISLPYDQPEPLHGGSAGSAATQRPRTTIRPVSCEKLAHVPGKTLTTVVVEFPPNAYSPKHTHGGSVSAYVLSGTVRSQLAGGPVGTFKRGDSWFEPLGATHLFAENASDTEPAEVLALFVADHCATLTTYDD